MSELPSENRRYLARASLRQSDESLEGECQLSFFIAGGPGGQHRNKTASAVRLVHLPTGLVVTATERRSQAQNRVMALVRLREKLYAMTRVPKERKATKISRAQKAKRLDQKRHDADRKRDRRWKGE